jgi:hypothetical protein
MSKDVIWLTTLILASNQVIKMIKGDKKERKKEDWKKRDFFFMFFT